VLVELCGGGYKVSRGTVIGMTIDIICQACGKKTSTEPYVETPENKCPCGAENFGYDPAALTQMLRGRDYKLVQTTREAKKR